MQARERRAVRMFIRRDTYGRYVSVLVYLPRDRYNTAVRERFAAILQDRLGAESVDFRSASTSPPPRGCTSWCACRGRGAPRRRHRRAGAPAHRGLALLARRLRRRRHRRARRGGGALLGRRYADPFPEAYKEDFAAAHRRGRPRPPRGASHRRRPGRSSTSRSTRPSTPATARRGSRSTGSGSRSRCPRCCRCCPRWASRSSTSGPTTLVGLTRPTHLYEFGLRYAGDAARRGARELFQDALRAVWDGPTRSTASTPWCCAPGSPGARPRCCAPTPTTCARAARRSRRTTSSTRWATTSTSPGCWCELFEARFDPDRDGEDREAAAEARRAADRARRWTTSPASTTTGSCAPT